MCMIGELLQNNHTLTVICAFLASNIISDEGQRSILTTISIVQGAHNGLFVVETCKSYIRGEKSQIPAGGQTTAIRHLGSAIAEWTDRPSSTNHYFISAISYTNVDSMLVQRDYFVTAQLVLKGHNWAGGPITTDRGWTVAPTCCFPSSIPWFHLDSGNKIEDQVSSP